MKIIDFVNQRRPVFSFEFFPPKTEEGVAQLFDTIAALRPLDPSFVSVTYGAGGSTRDRTVELVARIKGELGLEAMAHLTCVGHARAELHAVLDRIQQAGIENVLALRGDPPRGEATFVPAKDGLSYGSELVQLVREGYPFGVGGACYPEGHPEAESLEVDLERLLIKVQAGAEFLITQMFFDNRYYFDFVGQARAAGVRLPIIPGIMPVTNVDQLERFTSMCGATIPPGLRAELHRRKDNPEAVLQLGVAYATLQCADLLRRGAPGIHFYTLNKSSATSAILAALKLHRPWAAGDSRRKAVDGMAEGQLSAL